VKFWIDENIPEIFSKALARAGHKVRKSPSRTQDLTILRLAAKEKAVVVTFDKDFRQLVITEKRACAGVIWLRHIPPGKEEEAIHKLLHLIEERRSTLSTSFVTFALYKIEIISLK
jgi:predicted nuclease of predicted toxin-antitoxin system